MRVPTKAKGGVPPTFCSTSSMRPATGLAPGGAGAGAAGGGALAVAPDAAGARISSIATGSRTRRRAPLMQTILCARPDERSLLGDQSDALCQQHEGGDPGERADDQHGPIAEAPFLERGERDRVVQRMGDEARVQGA